MLVTSGKRIELEMFILSEIRPDSKRQIEYALNLVKEGTVRKAKSKSDY